jgi:hypothetical protein
LPRHDKGKSPLGGELLGLIHIQAHGRLELPESVAIMDAALGNRRKEGEGLTRVDVQHAAAGLASAAKCRRILEVLELADAASESAGKSRSRALIHVLGLPAPVLQRSFYDHEGFMARTDYFWPNYGVIGEFDGDAKYLDDELLGGRSTRAIILAEKKREDRLRALGYTIVRWDWKAVTDPDLLRRKLEGAGITTQESPPRGLIPLAFVTGAMDHVTGISPRPAKLRGPGRLPGRRCTSAERPGR